MFNCVTLMSTWVLSSMLLCRVDVADGSKVNVLMLLCGLVVILSKFEVLLKGWYSGNFNMQETIFMQEKSIKCHNGRVFCIPFVCEDYGVHFWI